MSEPSQPSTSTTSAAQNRLPPGAGSGSKLTSRNRLVLALALLLSFGLFAVQIGFGSLRESKALQSASVPGVDATAPLQPYLNQDAARWHFEFLHDDLQQSASAPGPGGGSAWGWTWLDNAPEGRPLYWSSLFFVYLSFISGLGWYFTGSVETGLPWANIPLLLLMLLLAGWLTARWQGLLAAMVLLLCAPGFYVLQQDFGYAMTDHHSMLNLCAMATLLLLAAGISLPASCVDPGKRALLGCAGVFTAAGLAVLATQMLALIGAIGLGIALWLILAWRSRDPHWLSRVDPATWRWWTWSAALCALLLYYLEFSPNLFSKRLEVNHPFWALGLAAGGEFLYRLHHLLLPADKQASRTPKSFQAYLLIMAALTASIPIATILIGGAQWHVMRDPLIYHIHRFIPGFQPADLTFWASPRDAYRVLANTGVLLILPLSAVIIGLRTRLWLRPFFLPLALPASLFFLLTLYQERWAGYAAISSLALVPLLFSEPVTPRVQRFLAPVLAGFFLVITLTNTIFAATVDYEKAVLTDAVAQVALRDLRDALYQSPEDRPQIVMISRHVPGGPFFPIITGAPIVGSLYWENAEGLHDEMAFFTTKNMDEAEEIARERKLDYVLTCARREVVENQLKYAKKAFDPASAQDTLIFRLCAPRPYSPDWLEPVPLDSQAAQLSDLRLYRVKLPPVPLPNQGPLLNAVPEFHNVSLVEFTLSSKLPVRGLMMLQLLLAIFLITIIIQTFFTENDAEKPMPALLLKSVELLWWCYLIAWSTVYLSQLAELRELLWRTELLLGTISYQLIVGSGVFIHLPQQLLLMIALALIARLGIVSRRKHLVIL